MPASRSSQTNTEPDLICCLSFSDSLLCTRGVRPSRHASKRMIASCGVWTLPWYVSIADRWVLLSEKRSVKQGGILIASVLAGGCLWKCEDLVGYSDFQGPRLKKELGCDFVGNVCCQVFRLVEGQTCGVTFRLASEHGQDRNARASQTGAFALGRDKTGTRVDMLRDLQWHGRGCSHSVNQMRGSSHRRNRNRR